MADNQTQPADPKADAISHLTALKESPGWKYILKALDENIADVDRQMDDPKMKELDPQKYMAQMTELLNKKNDRKELKDLPDGLIETFTNADALPPELDPYGK